MRPKVRPRAGPRAAGPRAFRAVRGERRGDLLGAEPGPGPGRPRRPAIRACKIVLVGLANHACPDGTGAFPSVATLVRYTGLSERTVRTCLDRLEAARIIQPCDPDIVAARIKRTDRRPQGWDLNLAIVRDDLAAADIGVREHQFPGLGARLDSTGQAGPDAALQTAGRPEPRGLSREGRFEPRPPFAGVAAIRRRLSIGGTGGHQIGSTRWQPRRRRRGHHGQ